MRPKTTGWKVPVLIGLLLIVALLIDLFFFTKAASRQDAKAHEQRQATANAETKQAASKLMQEKKDAEAKRIQDEAKAKAKEDEARKMTAAKAAAEHARFLARYLNSGFTRKPDVAVIGIAIESETGTMNPSIAEALAKRLGTGDVQVLNSFFKPDFVAGQYVDSILAGDTEIFDRLELTNWLNGVLIGRQAVTYSTNADLANTITANLRIQMMAFPVGSTRESESWTFSANGVGFNTSDARQQAEDRIVHQIASNQTMSLSNYSPKR